MPALEPEVELDGCGHADHLTLVVDQHAARVAGVDGSISLDDVRDGVARAANARVGGSHGAPNRADDTGGHGAIQSIGVTDGNGKLPDLYLVRVRQSRPA